jgi:pyruvate,water dikinase
VRRFDEVGIDDVASVGGKNASLGEMIRALRPKGIHVPDGFAVVADAYWELLRSNGLRDTIAGWIMRFERGEETLERAGGAIRALLLEAVLPEEVYNAIIEAYGDLCAAAGSDQVDVAVRSSATAEDLPDASFAGQQETFLNVRGAEAVIDACRRCYASLFTDRAIAYRTGQGYDHCAVALSIGIQRMVRSDLACSGVMFTVDPETGFPRTAVIDASWGLGEMVVQGAVTPDEYVVFKPLLNDPLCTPVIGRTRGAKEKKLIYANSGAEATTTVETSGDERTAMTLNDDEIITLAWWGCRIEEHYGRPMDIEWAKDGLTGQLYVVQARPETVQSRRGEGAVKSYTLTGSGEILTDGIAVGDAIAAGSVCRLESPADRDRFRDGCILVTSMTDPDWVPIMKRAAGIVTDRGGRTCHAAIVSRELGLPAIVGTGNATAILRDGQEVTISCAGGDRGVVYDGILPFEEKEISLANVPRTATRIMLNVASPSAALANWRLPAEGIGLARMEFIINDIIRIHPLALLEPERVEDVAERREIEELTRDYADGREYFVEKLALGIAAIAASQYPEPVIVRMSDFKTNEYADLIGGRAFEPVESNPMLGFRGASRYYSDHYREAFGLECHAIRRVREEIGLKNVIVMIPFCRTIGEADRVLATLAGHGLRRGENGLEVYVMAEIPSNIILADRFAERFDGFSIGSNDLTQLVLGVDRDSSDLAHLFDETDEAVLRAIRSLIDTAHAAGCKVGICGQAPSDHPGFAEMLVEAGIDSISLLPDSVVPVKRRVAELEARMAIERINRSMPALGLAGGHHVMVK